MHAVISADDPRAAPFNALVKRLMAATEGQPADVLLSSLLSVYRHALLDLPTFHPSAIRHLDTLLAELKGLERKQAPAAEPAPAGASAAWAGRMEVRVDELSPEVGAVVAQLAPSINSGNWPHNHVLPALFFLFIQISLAHRCCLQTGVDVLTGGAALLRAALDKQPAPAAVPAGHSLH